IDMILVGDSLGMCVYGYPGTVPVTMDQCIVHCEAVRRGAPGTFVIGAGADVDEQLLIVSDMLGTFQAFTPKFVKKCADLAAVSTAALGEYAKDVRAGAFPADEHCYHMLAGEAEKFAAYTEENR
ncbi:MAG: 3-methyl-2-oxobutanoate hydroxymethyltransferase, partial [Actinobacteria bacterium]|nr:3-methyl-2-oxobutanoate hydroxymethyltransferase [Actinomycetota bacterium]